MSSFSVDGSRRISLAEIAEIDYMPDIYLRPAKAGGSDHEPVPLLTIRLKAGERIRLEGKAASEAWERYQRACAGEPEVD